MSFDRDQLLILGKISDDNKVKYAHIARRIPISELADSTLVADIKTIISHKTTVQQRRRHSSTPVLAKANLD